MGLAADHDRSAGLEYLEPTTQIRSGPLPTRRYELDELAYKLRLEGQSLEQIAIQLGVTDEMVRRRIRRQKRLLQKTDEEGLTRPASCIPGT
jgi:hypothetical protein